MAVPFTDVTAHRARIGTQIDARIAAVVEHGRWIMGSEVAELEARLEAWIDSAGVQAISCASGTDALVLALRALELRPGQAVICPSFTFVATAEAVAFLGGVPVFADVSEDDFNIDPQSVAEAASSARAEGLQVVGIIAVDLFGLPADYLALRALAGEFDCWLIADAAQSFGGRRQGEKVGAMADVTTTSFFPTKPLGCYGDGGAVFTRDAGLAEVIRSLRIHGRDSTMSGSARVGQNSRLDTIQAAVLLAKLEILDDELESRRTVADFYAAQLRGHVATTVIPPDTAPVWAHFTVRVQDRPLLETRLDGANVGYATYYQQPIHRQSAFRQFNRNGVQLRASDRLSQTAISLPMSPYLTEREVTEVCAVIRSSGRPAH